MLMPGRKFSSDSYRYGFNGKENDNDVKGEGNQQDYGERIYDIRLGKFLTADPIAAKYPELTPYQFASNSPIQGIDLDGLELYKINGQTVVFDAFIRRQSLDVIEMRTGKAASAVMAPKEKADQIAAAANAKIYRPSQTFVASAKARPVSDYDKAVYQRGKEAVYDAQGYDKDGNQKPLSRLGNSEGWNRFTDHVVTPMAEIGSVLSLGGSAWKIATRGLAAKEGATVGFSTSNNYRATFFAANPELEGQVVVHHAVEQQVLIRYPNLFTEGQINSLENLRGIPNAVNSDLHLSQIRRAWNQFYRTNANPTSQQLLNKATEIDKTFGHQFLPSK